MTYTAVVIEQARLSVKEAQVKLERGTWLERRDLSDRLLWELENRLLHRGEEVVPATKHKPDPARRAWALADECGVSDYSTSRSNLEVQEVVYACQARIFLALVGPAYSLENELDDEPLVGSIRAASEDGPYEIEVLPRLR